MCEKQHLYFVATKPSESSKPQSIKHDFKTAPDGRLIISMGADEDSANDKAGGKKRKNVRKDDKDDIEDIDDLLEALGGAKSTGKVL